jgi:hypothetical protein
MPLYLPIQDGSPWLRCGSELRDSLQRWCDLNVAYWFFSFHWDE